jgi:hypothetical protein
MAKKKRREGRESRQRKAGKERRAGRDEQSLGGRAGQKALPLRNRPVLLVSLLLILIIAALFHQLVFSGKVLVSADAVAPMGFAAAAERSVEQGGPYPLWNPYVFLGMPSFGSLTYTPFVYFPDLILQGVHKVLPFLPSMTWLLIYYFVAGLFAFLFFKESDRSLLAGLFAGIAFMLTPNLVAIGAFGHGSKLINCAFIPVVMLFTVRLLRRGDFLSLGLLALVAGLQLLRAHVQIVYYTWLAVGLYCVTFLAFKSGDVLSFPVRLRRVAYVGVALAVALALGAVLYLPVHDYSAYSSRGAVEGGGMEFGRATDWSFSPVEMMTFLVPSWLGFGGPTYWGSMPFTDYPNYMGILPLFLAFLGLAGARRRDILYFLVLAIFSLLVSFGKHLEPLYRLLYEVLPYFNKFRVPVMILVLTQFAVAMLAAYGIENVLRERKSTGASRGLERASLWIALGFLGVVLVWLLFSEGVSSWYAGMVTGALEKRAALTNTLANFSASAAASNAARCFEMVKRDVLVVGAIGFAGFMCVYLFLRRRFSPVLLLAALACLTLVDLWRVDARILAPMVGERSSVTIDSYRDDVIDFLEKDRSLYRIFPMGRDFNENKFAAFGIASVGGYHAAKPSLYEKFQRSVVQAGRLSPAVLAMLNVKYIVIPQYVAPGEYLRLVYDGSRKIYEFAAPLPRAFLADSVAVLESERAVIDSMTAPDFDPGRTALLLEPVPVRSVTSAGSSVRIVSYGLNEIEIEASIAQPCFLVLSELYYPDWKAEVDGVQTTIHRADLLLRGMPLEPGEHKIRFYYYSRPLRVGLLLTVCASAFILASLTPSVVRLVRRRKREVVSDHTNVQ